MKIMNSLRLLIALLAVASPLSTLQANEDLASGEQVFETICSACHGLAGGMNMNQRLAPPMIAVREHYIGTYPDEESFVAAVSSWVQKQDESKSLMPGAIRRFNLMPPLSIDPESAKNVAAYIYAGELQSPEGFQEHYEAEHGD